MIFRPTPDYTQLVQVNEMEKPNIDDYVLTDGAGIKHADRSMYLRDITTYNDHARSLLRYPIASPGDEYWRSKSEFELDKDFTLQEINSHALKFEPFDKTEFAAHPVSIPEEDKQPGKVWPLLGYAPGNYMNKCGECGTMMSNVDKMCFMCLECAVKAAKRMINEYVTLVSHPPLSQPEKQAGPILDIRDAAILEETISVLKWMMESHTVDDKSLQSDAFNRPMNAINGLEYILERPIMNIPPSAQGETFSREFVQGFAEWILNDAHVTGGSDNMWWNALNHKWHTTSDLLNLFINSITNK